MFGVCVGSSWGPGTRTTYTTPEENHAAYPPEHVTTHNSQPMAMAGPIISMDCLKLVKGKKCRKSTHLTGTSMVFTFHVSNWPAVAVGLHKSPQTVESFLPWNLPEDPEISWPEGLSGCPHDRVEHHLIGSAVDWGSKTELKRETAAWNHCCLSELLPCNAHAILFYRSTQGYILHSLEPGWCK